MLFSDAINTRKREHSVGGIVEKQEIDFGVSAYIEVCRDEKCIHCIIRV